MRKIEKFINYRNSLLESSKHIVIVDVQQDYANNNDFTKTIKYLIEQSEEGRGLWWIVDEINGTSEDDQYHWLYTMIQDNGLTEVEVDRDDYDTDDEYQDGMHQKLGNEVESFVDGINFISKEYGGFREFMDEFDPDLITDLYNYPDLYHGFAFRLINEEI